MRDGEESVLGVHAEPLKAIAAIGDRSLPVQRTRLFASCLDCNETYDTADRRNEQLNMCPSCQENYGYRRR